jgi:hypothetical protein
MTFITSLDTSELVKAIYSLKSDENYFKDYVLPVLTLLLSSLISAGLAYKIARMTNDKAERIKHEKQKVTICNTWTLQAELCIQRLISIKEHFKYLDSQPYQRTLVIPPIILNEKVRPTLPLADLSFVTSPLNKGDFKWRQITYINLMFENYDYLISLVTKRTLLREELSKLLFLNTEFNQKKGVTSSLDDAIKIMDLPSLCLLLQLTEHVIVMTDDLILMFNDFIYEFPDMVESQIDSKILGKAMAILKFDKSKNEYRNQFMPRSPLADFTSLSEITGLSMEMLKDMYRQTYTPS